MLGASLWRLEQNRHLRILLSLPPPPTNFPFWKRRMIGRVLNGDRAGWEGAYRAWVKLLNSWLVTGYNSVAWFKELALALKSSFPAKHENVLFNAMYGRLFLVIVGWVAASFFFCNKVVFLVPETNHGPGYRSVSIGGKVFLLCGGSNVTDRMVS